MRMNRNCTSHSSLNKTSKAKPMYLQLILLAPARLVQVLGENNKPQLWSRRRNVTGTNTGYQRAHPQLR